MSKVKSKNKNQAKPKPKAKKRLVNTLKKKAKVQAKVKDKPKLDPRIERIYEDWVEFVCPVRGKVRQKVKITRYKSHMQEPERHVLAGNTASEQADALDDGLHIYAEIDEEKA